MKYRKNWDLTSIPLDAIPDELLKSWWAKRSAARREYTIERAPTKEIAEKRRVQRELLMPVKNTFILAVGIPAVNGSPSGGGGKDSTQVSKFLFEYVAQSCTFILHR